MADKVGADRFDVWFGSHVTFAFEEGRCVVTASDEFRADRLRRVFRHEIAVACREAAGYEVEVEFRVGARPAISEAAKPTRTAPAAVAPARATGPAPRPRITAQDERPQVDRLPFLVGPEHKIAHASAELVLDQPGKVTPLYLYGPTGAGKTHFLEMIRNEARRRTRLRRIVSVSAEQFTTQFLEALQGRGLPSFRRKFRDVELLIIDDLQFFTGKRTTLVELQNTVDTLLRGRRQLVFAADRSPAELSGFSEVLLGRLAGGLVCCLPYPEQATRRRILQQLAGPQGGLPNDVLDMMATSFSGDARQLTGAVHRLAAVSQALGCPVDLPLAMAALEDLIRAGRRAVRLTDIEEAICGVFGLEKQTLQSGDRGKYVTQPRMLAMWLARRHTRAGLSEISRVFGRRSPSTVVSAEQQVKRWLSRGSSVRLAHGECSIADAIRRVEAQLRTG
jgi:chromosomal replication initiator protein